MGVAAEVPSTNVAVLLAWRLNARARFDERGAGRDNPSRAMKTLETITGWVRENIRARG